VIDTAQKRQAALSTSVKSSLPFPDGTIDVTERGSMLGVYWIESTAGSTPFVMARRWYQGEGKPIYKGRGKQIYQPAGKSPYKP